MLVSTFRSMSEMRKPLYTDIFPVFYNLEFPLVVTFRLCCNEVASTKTENKVSTHFYLYSKYSGFEYKTIKQKEYKNRRQFTRNFSKAMYGAADWLCSCYVKNTVFF